MFELFEITQHPLVSVIISAYNAEKYIEETINSILQQTYFPIEIVVVNDGSTDNTHNILQSFKTAIIYFEIKNSGASFARNYAIKHSTGELIAPFDADDIMLPDKIEQQVLFLKRNAHVALLLTDYSNFGDSHFAHDSHFNNCNYLKKVIRTFEDSDIILKPQDSCRILPSENFTIMGAALFHREILKSIGYIDESLVIGEDFEFFYRIARKYDIGLINKIGFKRRIHENNLMKGASLKILPEKISSRKRILEYETNSLFRKKINKSIAVDYASLSSEYTKVKKKQSLEYLTEALFYNKNPFNIDFCKALFKIIFTAFFY